MRSFALLARSDPWRLTIRPRDPRVAELSNDDARALRAAQLNAVFRLTPTLLAGQVTSLATILFVSWRGGPQILLGAWAISLSAVFSIWFRRWLLMRKAPARLGASIHGVRVLTINSLMIGVLWTVPLAALFDNPDPVQRMVVASLTTGLVSGGALAMATVWQASFAFTAIVMIPAMLNLINLGADGDTVCLTLVAMAVSLIFVIGRSVYERSELFVESHVANVKLRGQGQIISLLLKDFEDHASDFLWETDVEGRLNRVSPRLAQIVRRTPDELEGVDFAGLMEKQSPAEPSRLSGLGAQLGSREPFRDHNVELTIDGERRQWSITGKPIFDMAGGFQGFRGVGSDITATERLANFDVLTGLPNRALFQRHVELAVARLKRGGAGFTLFSLDLDRFKRVNDTLGHAIGDAVLCAVATRLTDCLGPNDVATRFGGDEFVIFRDDPEPADARALGELLIAEICRPFEIQDYRILIGVSIGIALAPADGDAFDALLRNSDLALYRAKSDGRGVLCFFAAELDEAMQARRQLEVNLRGALGSNELSLHFQPLVDMRTGAISTCEALVRWHSPRYGNVSPADFIPLAEETGLIAGLGEWVLVESCKAAALWPRETRVAVNVSPVQLRSGGVGKAVERALAASGLSPERLEIEITESVFVENWAEIQETLKTLQALGVRVSLDDFGTGYSSLSYLCSFKFDKLKIDKSFVHGLGKHDNSAAVVKAIAALAADLGISITAEGVETEEQLELLAAHGCTEAQGFLFSRPVDATDIVFLLGAPVVDPVFARRGARAPRPAAPPEAQPVAAL
ncbi:MAG: EAL domain-containing protein [Roseiarcus sp.]|jgi:diguanylate cyclase (GGDEF)-like protein/PAS domain S-box-containing protein